MADDLMQYGDLPYVMSGLPRRRNPYDARRQMAMGMVQGGMDFSPVQHPLQGASRLAQALVGTLMMRNADSEEAAADKARQEAFGKAMDTMQTDPQAGLAMLGKVDPETGVKIAANMAAQRIKRDEDAKAFQNGGTEIAAGYNMGGGMGGPANAIASIESGGRYDALGPQVPGQGQAHGKYQVMPANIGPWTKEVLGQELTPAQFLASPQAQDAVFQAKFGQYVQKYGPQGAARAWFAGEGGMNNPNARDINGTTVAGYEQKFVRNGGAGPVVAQGDNVQQLPVPRPVADGSGNPLPPDQPPAFPNVPRPQPSQAVLQQATAMYQQGLFGKDPAQAKANARQWVESQIESDWTRRREQAKAEYDMQVGDFKDRRTQANKAPQEAFQNANTLRKEYSSEPITKQYREVVPIIESVQEAVGRPTRAADLNLIYALGKIMDPNSVVREGEMVMARGTGTVQDTINGLLGQLNGSPTLTPDTRQKLVTEIISRFKGIDASHSQIADVYKGIAQRNGLPVEDIIIPIRPPKPAGEQPAAPGAGNASAPPPPPPGFRPLGGR